MIVEKVSANIRYSQDTGKGAWKGHRGCLGELAISPGVPVRRVGQADENSVGQREQQRQHLCEQHQAESQRRSKNGVVWYSHRQGKSWCPEAS